MYTIKEIKAFELLDSRSNPTVATHILLSDGSKGFAVVPSGASTGIHEALELRDGEKERFCGKGVKRAVKNVNETIADALRNNSFLSQNQLDNTLIELDNTADKSELGANAMLSVSLAFARAAAASDNKPLYRYIGGMRANSMPVPMLNILNGGAHADNNIDIQEFMIVPDGINGFSEQIRAACEIYHALKAILKEGGKSTAVGDEGGFAPNLQSDEEALDVICEAITKAGYSTNCVHIALDIASSEWVCGDAYHLKKRDASMSSDELIEYYEQLISKYPIISIEDGLAEDDFEGWQKLTARLGNKIMLVGDDLFVTNAKRLKFGIEQEVANSVLVKLNQIGTLSETLAVMEVAQKNGYKNIVSHRSGESEDSFIADLAVAVNAPFIKAGAPCRSDRTAKYNRLLLIEQEL